MSRAAVSNDKRVLLWITGIGLVLILVVSFLIPAHSSDQRPLVNNNGSGGAKAAFLLLPQLGYKVARWDAPEADLSGVEAAHTTLVLAETYVPAKQMKATSEALQHFLERGGHILLTGDASLLPGGKTSEATGAHYGLCETTPEGQGALALAGKVSLVDASAWDEQHSTLGPALHVEQRCGDDAVVVRYAFGQGEVVWWTSATPLTNSGLHDDASLKLVLASVGDTGRTVLFDEYVHGTAHGLWDGADRLPLKWLFWQLVLIAVLLIFSFSRRRGPLRSPVTVPRSSPVEFAESMGHLYQRAGATSAATGMARRRLLRFVQNECGIARVVIDEGADAIGAALHERLGGDWSALSRHLADAKNAEHAELAPRSALRLVQALDEDVERLQAILAPVQTAARETMTTQQGGVEQGKDGQAVEEQEAELISATEEQVK